MGIEGGGGYGGGYNHEHYSSKPEHHSQPEYSYKPEKPQKAPEKFGFPEVSLEDPPDLYHNLKTNNKLISQLYQYASGHGHHSPSPELAPTPQAALAQYLTMTTGGEGIYPPIFPPVTPGLPTPPVGQISEILPFDPYANDPNRMTAIDRRAARKMFESLENSNFAVFVDEALGKFKDAFSKTEYPVPEQDQLDVAGKLQGTGMKPFREAVMVLLAKYLVLKQKAGQFDEASTRDTITTLLQNGFYSYSQAFAWHIPYYDTAFTYFSGKREDKGSDPREVYLGRDGEYAYVARRAMDLSTRRAYGLNKRLDFKDVGMDIAVKPKYLVYPRFYRDHISPETKREYLESQGIDISENPVFFDTGYTGTIPDQILELLGVTDPAEKDKHIKMLSAEKEERRIPGLPPEERRSIVQAVEYSVKAENPSSSMYRKSNGQIEHTAKPTTPEEQFTFEMARMALVRHYWLESRQIVQSVE